MAASGIGEVRLYRNTVNTIPGSFFDVTSEFDIGTTSDSASLLRTGLKPGTTYWYWAEALDVNGNTSGIQFIGSATTAGAPPVPWNGNIVPADVRQAFYDYAVAQGGVFQLEGSVTVNGKKYTVKSSSALGQTNRNHNPYNAFNGTWATELDVVPNNWHSKINIEDFPHWLVLELPDPVEVGGITLWATNHTYQNRQPLEFEVFGGSAGTDPASDTGWTKLYAGITTITADRYNYPGNPLAGGTNQEVVNRTVAAISGYPGLVLQDPPGDYEDDILSSWRMDLTTGGVAYTAYRLKVHAASGTLGVELAEVIFEPKG